jgi:hypothetical protein
MAPAKLRNWKIADILGQVGAIVLPYLWYVFVTDFDGEEENSMFTAMLIGSASWVAISLLAHLGVMREPWITIGRKVLSMVYLLIVIIVPIIAFLQKPWDHSAQLVMIILAACIPVLGVPYFVISIAELQKINQLRGRK